MQKKHTKNYYQINPKSYKYWKDQRWAEPKIDEASIIMRDIFKNSQNNYKKNYIRLVKFNENISLKVIWINLLEKNKTSYQLSINPTKYNKLEYFTGLKPKILFYEQNNVILEFENSFNNKQINFLINFF